MVYRASVDDNGDILTIEADGVVAAFEMINIEYDDREMPTRRLVRRVIRPPPAGSTHEHPDRRAPGSSSGVGAGAVAGGWRPLVSQNPDAARLTLEAVNDFLASVSDPARREILESTLRAAGLIHPPGAEPAAADDGSDDDDSDDEDYEDYEDYEEDIDSDHHHDRHGTDDQDGTNRPAEDRPSSPAGHAPPPAAPPSHPPNERIDKIRARLAGMRRETEDQDKKTYGTAAPDQRRRRRRQQQSPADRAYRTTYPESSIDDGHEGLGVRAPRHFAKSHRRPARPNRVLAWLARLASFISDMCALAVLAIHKIAAVMDGAMQDLGRAVEYAARTSGLALKRAMLKLVRPLAIRPAATLLILLLPLCAIFLLVWLRSCVSMTPVPGYYHVLNVSTTATQREIRAAWRRIVKIHHPDKLLHAVAQPNSSAGPDLALVNEAYATLSHRDDRCVYDWLQGLPPSDGCDKARADEILARHPYRTYHHDPDLSDDEAITPGYGSLLYSPRISRGLGIMHAGTRDGLVWLADAACSLRLVAWLARQLTRAGVGPDLCDF